MRELARRITLMAALFVGVCGSGAFAQDNSAPSGRDLTVEAATPHARPWRHPRRPVQVSLVPVGASTLSIGQPLRFRMESIADGYGQLYALSASGRTQLWLENVRLRAGRFVDYPRPGFVVRAAPPAGDETIVFVASRAPLS